MLLESYARSCCASRNCQPFPLSRVVRLVLDQRKTTSFGNAQNLSTCAANHKQCPALTTRTFSSHGRAARCSSYQGYLSSSVRQLRYNFFSILRFDYKSRNQHVKCSSKTISLDIIWANFSNLPPNWCRNFSNTSDSNRGKHSNNTGNQEESETVKKKNMGTNLAIGKILLKKPMDADFEKYLTGEMKTFVEQSPKTRPSQQSSSGVVPIVGGMSGRDTKNLYARVLLKKKEKARLKTAQTVHVALMGNVVICAAKFGVWLSSGSSGLLAEFIHSVVDCGNQGLLLLGLRDSTLSADRAHPYGYGKSVYFWALVSALGTFFLGAGVSMTHTIGDMMDPKLHQITWEVWSVLLFSLAVDGYVFSKTLLELNESKPKNRTLWRHLQLIRDPATLAILLEDGAACLGVVIALGGIAATHYSGNPVFDGMAGVAISTLLGGMGVALASMNYRFLLGQGVEKEITDDIAKMLLNRRSIDSIGSVQSQWTGPETFSYKAEVDFDGTSIAAELMTVRDYQNEVRCCCCCCYCGVQPTKSIRISFFLS